MRPQALWLGEDAAGLPPGLTPALLCGYGVFTTFRWPLGEARLTRHLCRLLGHAQALAMRPPALSAGDLAAMLAARLSTPCVVRLSLVPDTPTWPSLWEADTLSAMLVITTRPRPARPQQAVSLQRVVYQKAFATIKHHALAEALLLRRQARAAGFDDALWCHPTTGRITETTTANVFWFWRDALWTADPQADGCLGGIARDDVLALARDLGLAVHSQALPNEALGEVQGGFLTNAVQGLTPIARVEATPLAWTPETHRLLALLETRYNALPCQVADMPSC